MAKKKEDKGGIDSRVKEGTDRTAKEMFCL